jgi:hypothetical protein
MCSVLYVRTCSSDISRGSFPSDFLDGSLLDFPDSSIMNASSLPGVSFDDKVSIADSIYHKNYWKGKYAQQ